MKYVFICHKISSLYVKLVYPFRWNVNGYKILEEETQGKRPITIRRYRVEKKLKQIPVGTRGSFLGGKAAGA
jgi:hypothetical protein